MSLPELPPSTPSQLPAASVLPAALSAPLSATAPDGAAVPTVPTVPTAPALPVLPPGQFDAQVEQLFAEDGPLGQAVDGFRPRRSQTDMARAIAEAIANRTTLIAEAGTGTGKTFAYLVPGLSWGGKVIISTGTKNLQDQLFLRDIPTVRKALRLPVSVALLKGRANYACHYHLERTLQNGRLTHRDDVSHLREIRRFMQTTQTGDKAELAKVPENASIWNLVTSTRENCLGSECQFYQDCFVMKARKEAQQADVVVVNHHLFFADVALKDSGVAELLPSANTIIFDEAHQLHDTASLFFGVSTSTSQILELCRDVLAEGLTHARDGANWPDTVAPLELAVRDLRLCFPHEGAKLALHQIMASSPFFPAIATLHEQLGALCAVLEQQAERAEEIDQCRLRALELVQQLAAWQQAARAEQSNDASSTEQGNVLWVEAFSSSVQLHQTPLSIAPIFNKQREGVPRSWIFTSATLAVKRDFSHFAERMGLSGEVSYSWPSPFDYASQGILYVPTGLPQPHETGYTDAVIDAALPVLAASEGRAFLLCTTLRAVNRAAERLRTEFAARGWPYPLLVQGEAGRTELLEQFRKAGNAVLVGSQSFWEGIDVRGRALSLVIIDKLPFAPPDDPVLAARIAQMEQRGLNGFMHHQLPEAIINLKQGAGRLIRDETDHGVLMICDPRLISKSYGRRIWQSLPPFTRSRELSDIQAFFADGHHSALV